MYADFERLIYRDCNGRENFTCIIWTENTDVSSRLNNIGGMPAALKTQNHQLNAYVLPFVIPCVHDTYNSVFVIQE